MSELGNLIGLYTIQTVLFNALLMVYSYGYYARVSRASTHVRSQFVAALVGPIKWLFSGESSFVERTLLHDSGHDTMEAFIEHASIFMLQLRRFSTAILCLLPSGLGAVILAVRRIPVTIEHLLYFAITLGTLYASLRFGRKLQQLYLP
jgi:hypothetical protein